MKTFLKKKKPGRHLIYAILCFEIGFSMYSFLWSPEGIQHLYALYAQQTTLQASIYNEQNEIVQMEKTIQGWTKYVFYKEKIAREELQMACADEIIYYIPPRLAP